MEYLSQRLASKPGKARGRASSGDALAAGQRRRILDAAEQLIGQHGCAGTSIEAIVKAAGVSSVTFYEHFEDKEACFVAAFDRAVLEAAAIVREATAGLDDWPQRVEAALRALLAAAIVEPARARLCLVEAQGGGPLLLARHEATLDAVIGQLRQGRLLESAPRGLPDTVEEAAVGGIAWLLRQRIELRQTDDVEALLPKLTEIAVSPYMGATNGPATVGSDG
jgi:AcrR family transcriptional regulator